MDISTVIENIYQTVEIELTDYQQLTGEKLASFTDVFGINPEAIIYYTDDNIIITEVDTFNALQHYFKEENKIAIIDIPEYNTHVWVYKYFNDHLFENYLNH